MIPITRLTALERDAARSEGERGALVSSMAHTKGKITETELQILQVDRDLHSEVDKDLSDIRGKLAELVEKKVAAEDQLKRIDIRAPQDGIVHELAIHTIGGVVNAGEQIMLVVPRADALTAAKIASQETDKVRVGHLAIRRFSAFGQRTTPELSGNVGLVPADVAQDQKTGTGLSARDECI
jgi:HlyD family secretion protein